MNSERRNAIVTGAASGLGRALALRLAADGWKIAVADIDEAGTEETLKLIESAGGSGRAEHLDVSSLEDWESLSERLRTDWSHLDLLVNNAGVGFCGNIGTFPIEEWHQLLGINLYGGIYGCHVLVDWLKENPHGAHIINTASFAAIAPSPSMSAYNVAKAGLVALSETLYSELMPYGVGVSVVCPMFFNTNICDSARTFDEFTKGILVEGTQRSMLSAEDIADATLRAMRRKQLYVIPGRLARRYWWMRRFMPTGFLKGIVRDTAKRRRRFELTAKNK